MKIYKSQYGWSTLAKGKDKNNEELKKYIGVRFSRKCVEPSGDEATINLVNWFPTCFKRNNGEIDVQFMVMEYTLESEEFANPKSSTEEKFNEFVRDNDFQMPLGSSVASPSDYEKTQAPVISPDDLPFY